MSKSTSVIVDRLLVDDSDVGDYVKCTLPELKWKVATIAGSGVAGDVDIPLQGLAEAMSFQIDLRSVGKDNIPAILKPGSRKLELRFNRNVVLDDGSIFKAGTKIYITGMSTGIAPGNVERGSAMDGNATFSVLRIRHVEDGQELYVFDALNQVYKVGGVDYSEQYRI